MRPWRRSSPVDSACFRERAGDRRRRAGFFRTMDGQQPAQGAPAGRGDMGSRSGSPLTITQDASRITIEYHVLRSRGSSPAAEIRLAPTGANEEHGDDGTRHAGPVVETAWDGDKLVITMVDALSIRPRTPRPPR